MPLCTPYSRNDQVSIQKTSEYLQSVKILPEIEFEYKDLLTSNENTKTTFMKPNDIDILNVLDIKNKDSTKR